MNNPKISIVVPTYGRAEYLKNLIASVRASTPQDAYELVVVSSDLPESEKVKWLSQQKGVDLILADTRKEWQLKKRGMSYYMNLGIKKSRNEWVMGASDDMRFDENWYKEFADLLSDPNNLNAGLIIISTHSGKVKYGFRIVKMGKTKKEDRDWKDWYLADLYIIRRDVLKEVGFFDEKMDWAGCSIDNSLAVEFLTNKDTIISEKIKVGHFIADENRNKNLVDEFTDYNYLINKWNEWCQANNCQYVWEIKPRTLKTYTLKNRVVNYLYNKARILRHYGRYIMGAYRQK